MWWNDYDPDWWQTDEDWLMWWGGFEWDRKEPTWRRTRKFARRGGGCTASRR